MDSKLQQKNKLYVGNLPFQIDEAGIEDAFAQYGEIAEVKIIKDRETGRSKGFAFVTFTEDASASSALEMDGKEIGGRTAKVSEAMEKPRKPRY